MVRLRDRHSVNNAASLLLCGLLAGLVLAAAAFPALAVTGLAAKVGADSFQELPTDLEVLPPPETSYLYAADGKTRITGFYEENRQNVPLKDMSPLMRKAIVAAEDARFYDHHGVDLKGVMRALVANSGAGEVKQGASTLTMQYVRQALTYSARTPAEVRAVTADTPARKLKEIRYAIALEKRLSKDQILENYLNIAYFGHKAYGVYAASYAYFSKHPKDLTLEEAAMLAAAVRAPSVYDPSSKDSKERDAILERRNWVMSRMVDEGYVDAADAEKAQKKDITLKRKVPPNSCVDVPPKHQDWGFFCAYFVTWWKQQKAFGANSVERENNLKRGGYKIITSLDPKLQNIAIKNIKSKKNVHNKMALGGVFIEPGTGRIMSMAVNRNYSNDNSKNHPHSDQARFKGKKGNYPNTTNALLGGDGGLGYQAGSTFKMFTMLAALEEGLPLATEFQSPHKYRSQYVGGTASDKSACQVNGVYHWCPRNASKHMAGMRNMWSGFGMSVNTYFVQLVETVGAEKAVKMAEKLGLVWHAGDKERAEDPDQAKRWGSFTLGVANTTPLEMANAYATIAAEGKYCEPLPVRKITDRTGKELPGSDPTCEQRLTPDVARAATDAARCPVGDPTQGGGSCGGNATGASVGRNVNQPVAGKTGTTDSNAAAWFAGYTPKLAGAMFETDPDNFDNSVYSTHEPSYAFGEILREYLGNRHTANFTPPPKSLAKGDMKRVPGVTCRGVDDATRTLENAGFKVRKHPDQVPSRCAQGTVAYTKPSGEAPKNGYVTLFISNGEPPPKKPDKPDKPGGPGGPGGPTRPPDDEEPCRPNNPWCPPDRGD
ncbi:MAG: penicillin-binding protein [Micromonosporaceae bacterium]